MRKLKKQAEHTKQRKEQTKREKIWVGGSTTPRESAKKIDTTGNGAKAGFDFEALD